MPSDDFVRNAFVRSGRSGADGPDQGQYALNPDNAYFRGDPGFIDAERMNFEFKADAEIFRRLPGFQRIPFGAIGVEWPAGSAADVDSAETPEG